MQLSTARGSNSLMAEQGPQGLEAGTLQPKGNRQAANSPPRPRRAQNNLRCKELHHPHLDDARSFRHPTRPHPMM